MKYLSLLLVPAALWGYVPGHSSAGAIEHRSDSSNIQFTLNSQAVAGLTNSTGALWITADADVVGAVTGALNTWNAVSTAKFHFAPIQSTTALDGTEGQNTIAFDDSTEDREAISTALAVTLRYSEAATGIIDRSDIIFNPLKLYSTNLASGTYDIQSLLTHELGHALGASHSGVLSATMFQASGSATNSQSFLSPDDIAWVTSTYPGDLSGYGTLTGSVKDSAGNVLRGALVSAEDPTTGLIVGGLSDLTDGTFSILIPPGTYQVWVEPLTGIVERGNVGLTTTAPSDSNFQPAFASGMATVTAQSSTSIDVVAPVGASTVGIQYAGAVPSSGGSFLIHAGPSEVTAGQTVDFVIQAKGLGSDFVDANVTFVGPVSVVPGSVFKVGTNQFQMTIDVAAVASTTAATMVLDYKGQKAVYSGGMLIHPPAPAFTAGGVGNVFSYASSAIAPGEIVAIFGTNLGPAVGAAGAFDGAGNLSTVVGGVKVTVNGLACPIFYAGSGQVNVQIPYEVSGQSSVPVVVTNGTTVSTAVSVQVAESLPGLFVAAVNPDYSLNSQSNRIAAGTYATLYVTGLGNKSPAVLTGAAVSGIASSVAPVTAFVNGTSVTPYYAGAAPGFTGLDQINVQIPADAPSGSLPVYVSVNGQVSQPIQVWVK